MMLLSAALLKALTMLNDFLNAVVRTIDTHVTAKALYYDFRLYYSRYNRDYKLVIFADECRAALFATKEKWTFLDWQVQAENLKELLDEIKQKYAEK